MVTCCSCAARQTIPIFDYRVYCRDVLILKKVMDPVDANDYRLTITSKNDVTRLTARVTHPRVQRVEAAYKED